MSLNPKNFPLPKSEASRLSPGDAAVYGAWLIERAGRQIAEEKLAAAEARAAFAFGDGHNVGRHTIAQAELDTLLADRMGMTYDGATRGVADVGCRQVFGVPVKKA